MRHGTSMLVVLALGLGVTGCRDSGKAQVVPVQGKILFADGRPLPIGTRLIFNPASGEMGGAVGVTDESGVFKVTHQSGKNGAGVGKYTIQLTAPDGQGAEFYKLVPRAYFDNGGILVAEVTEGMGEMKLVVKK